MEETTFIGIIALFIAGGIFMVLGTHYLIQKLQNQSKKLTISRVMEFNTDEYQTIDVKWFQSTVAVLEQTNDILKAINKMKPDLEGAIKSIAEGGSELRNALPDQRLFTQIDKVHARLNELNSRSTNLTLQIGGDGHE